MSTGADQLNYIRNILVEKIVGNLKSEELISYDVQPATGLNGFMSAIYNLHLQSNNTLDKRKHVREIIVKLMKGDKNFREFGGCYIQFPNEIFIYNTVLPYYQKIAEASTKCKINVSAWTPKVYHAEYGIVKGLDESAPESVLATENLTILGYRNGPREHLDRQHLLLMAKLIAEYHVFTYALRIRRDTNLSKLIDGIIPFPFTHEKGTNLYYAGYLPTFERFFSYFDRIKSSLTDNVFIKNVEKFRTKHGEKPVELLEHFREIDETFSVILHGDFNRNNVLFRYDEKDGYDNPRDIKTIDFQELRYGTPAIDLSFFMYMNMDPSIREDFWMELLQYYHTTLIKSIADILNVDGNDESLDPYRFEKFYKHFSKFALYGVIICIDFIPCMTCNEDECAQVSKLFEEDMFGEGFKKTIKQIGGDKSNKIILDIVHHASRQGYMDNWT